ncbi:ABC transporter permease [Isoptericola variabilis]|uniref:ABC-type transporter, integral membrane subunit n=1 Tax=Isoptericola variabilis (strain 225) TaxID=743718 RepID=F6FPJ2_ISOV2|nr:ABC transporter permease [Isoptericola variabilis]AEG43705.1 ABC-type transporter, integral membrane subunit [Isoptericola variabilis 225]TWH27385.1 peptide/nickel transport system permease protein [Isoptericola variabilis J7]
MSDIRNTSPRGEDFEPVPTAHGIDVEGGVGAGVATAPLPTEDKSYSQGQLVRRRFFHHRGAIISMIVLGVIVLVAFSSIGIGPIPGWWDKNPTLQYEKVGTGAPTWAHPFGQDTIGKDYFALVMLGTQKSIIIALGVGLISTVIGTVVGALAGYFRGWVESLLMRLTDLLIVIPLLVLAAVLGKMASQWGIWGLTVMLGIVSWTGLARLVRGEVLSLRERDFVVAATAVGTGSNRIIFKHILPNAVGTIIVSATLTISSAILLETSLSFLGFGVQAPDTSLGLLISQYQTAFTTRPWLFWWPGLMILAIALCVNFIGDGLRDAFDPRQNRTKA